jgi:hypothetical protein
MFTILWPRRTEARRRPTPAHPRLEMLENRVVPAIRLVNNLGTDAAMLVDSWGNRILSDLTIDVSVPTTKGDRIIVETAASSGRAVEVSDSKGNSYHLDNTLSGITGPAIFSAEITNPLGFGDEIRVHIQGGQSAAASATEWHGLLEPDPADQEAGGSGQGPGVSTSATPPTSQPGELLIGAVQTGLDFAATAPSLSPGAGYTTLPDNHVIPPPSYMEGVAVLPEYRIVNAIGSYVADGTIRPAVPDTSGSQWSWAAAIQTYKAAPDVAQSVHLEVIPDHSSVGAGTPFSVTVIAEDDQGNVLTNYTGTVHFSSTDPHATLPPDYAFTTADAGRHTFVNGVTLRTPGPQTITAQDVAVPTIRGSATVQVSAHFDVIPEHATVAAGAPFSVTVIAKDDQGNVLTNYTGTVRFSGTDPAATLPADYPFTSADGGQHTFTGVVLRTPGAQTITAEDVAVPTITGSTTVQVTSPAQSAHLDLIPDRSSVAPGGSFSVTVIARDGAGNVLTSYTGTVRFGSSDPAAGLPPDYAFTPADGGQHTFAGITLRTPGAQTITAQDVAIQATVGSTAIQVAAPPPVGGTQVVGTQVMQAGNHGRSMYLLVTLNADVDPASAQDLSHYALFSSVKGHPRRRHQVPLMAADYNAATCTVVLTVGKRRAADRRATLVVLGLPGQAGLIAVPVNLGMARRR